MFFVKTKFSKHKLFIYEKKCLDMACSCKGGSTKKQVTTVKQVTKKSPDKSVMAASRPQKKPVLKRVILRRPM